MIEIFRDSYQLFASITGANYIIRLWLINIYIYEYITKFSLFSLLHSINPPVFSSSRKFILIWSRILEREIIWEDKQAKDDGERLARLADGFSCHRCWSRDSICIYIVLIQRNDRCDKEKKEREEQTVSEKKVDDSSNGCSDSGKRRAVYPAWPQFPKLHYGNRWRKACGEMSFLFLSARILSTAVKEAKVSISY